MPPPFEFFKKLSCTTLPPYARHLLQFPAGLGGLGDRSPTLATTGFFIIPYVRSIFLATHGIADSSRESKRNLKTPVKG
jgi:hypothetical protein